jgi:cysteine desulfuration protein SufE
MKLDELIAEFQDLEPDEKLEWLVEFAEQLPDLSPARASVPFPEVCRVQECQTPVYLWIEGRDGKIHLEADVPRKSPTVRGLVALLVIGLNGEPVSAMQSLPDDLISVLGLNSALGMTRQQGIRGVVARLKQSVGTGVPLNGSSS